MYSGVLSQSEGTNESILRRLKRPILNHESFPSCGAFDPSEAVLAGKFWSLDPGGVPTSFKPHIVYRYDGNLYSINLPPLFM